MSKFIIGFVKRSLTGDGDKFISIFPMGVIPEEYSNIDMSIANTIDHLQSLESDYLILPGRLEKIKWLAERDPEVSYVVTAEINNKNLKPRLYLHAIMKFVGIILGVLLGITEYFITIASVSVFGETSRYDGFNMSNSTAKTIGLTGGILTSLFILVSYYVAGSVDTWANLAVPIDLVCWNNNRKILPRKLRENQSTGVCLVKFSVFVLAIIALLVNNFFQYLDCFEESSSLVSKLPQDYTVPISCMKVIAHLYSVSNALVNAAFQGTFALKLCGLFANKLNDGCQKKGSKDGLVQRLISVT